MDARAERIRRLRRAAAVWWVWTFIVALGTLLIAGSVTQLRGPMRPRSILVHLDSRDGGGWRATVLDADTFTPNADISDCSASGYYIVIPDRGSRSSNGLGFWRRSFRWELARAQVSTKPTNQPYDRTGAETVPAGAWATVIEALEHDAFDDTVRRDPVSQWLQNDPEFDPLTAVWHKVTSGWSAREFRYFSIGYACIATLAASIIGGVRFALPLLIRRVPPGCCASCGYELAGLEPSGDQHSVTCPECGAASTLEKKT